MYMSTGIKIASLNFHALLITAGVGSGESSGFAHFFHRINLKNGSRKILEQFGVSDS